MRRTFLLPIVLIAVAYIAIYWIVRESNTFIYERDGCPSRGCVEVRFPGTGVYMIFAPIYLLDKNTNGDTTFFIV